MSSRTQQPIPGKVVAITGAARGIGKATARALIARGAKVAIGDVDIALATQTAQELGGGTIALLLDVTDRTSVDAFVEQTEEQLGPIDVFINNAGIMPTTWFLEEDEASIQRQFSINVMGPINGMRSVIPRMLERGRGHVINVASSAGKFPVPGIATYCGTKHAVVGITGAMRGELKDTPVDVSVVMPVIVRTELTDGVPDTRGVKALQPEDVADAIVEAIETRRYEVWCPKSTQAIYKTTAIMPMRLNDAIAKVTKGDRLMIDALGSPDRQKYLDRISTDTPAMLGSGKEE
ncbi:SDR family oxidoreductase [Svornostia abyssi]|uniref:SDR family oxidoreductase n=1 Tax=Svornostia abyssi TaxID=2898438 RepID=A0ABY5PHY8_9ACTN|nr:SDR family oxidoreductase [Parviterribacteraceae bacterium J379]